MKLHSMTFFSGVGKGPRATLNASKEDHYGYPGTISIRPTSGSFHSITVHLASEADLIAFKNSVIYSYNEYRKELYG